MEVAEILNRSQICQVYAEAMHTCLANAEQWLEDAKVLAEHGSNSHCRALQNIAGEELAKAAVCWLVVNNYLRYNHPLVHYNSGTGVFRDHDTKNLVATILGNFSIHITNLKRQNIPITKRNLEPYVQNPLVDPVYLEVASWGEAKRLEWQYVDIISKDDSLVVSDPLKKKTKNFLAPITSQEKQDLLKKAKTRPIPEKRLIELVINKTISLLDNTDIGPYANKTREIEFMKELIATPKNEIALLFQEEIKAIYDLYKINRKHIKKKRVKQK